MLLTQVSMYMLASSRVDAPAVEEDLGADGTDTDDTVPDDGCFCIALYDPVCGENGKTYGNACEAACADVEIAHEGECAGCGGCVAGEPDAWPAMLVVLALVLARVARRGS